MNLIAANIAPRAPRFSSAIQQINHPVHNGAANPAHGMFMIVGSIPEACYDAGRNGGRGGSVLYKTEQDAIDGLIAAGAPYIQRANCSRV